jgi:hypothetical protein
MARRSTIVAVTAAVLAACPASASAVTAPAGAPQIASTPYALPVTLHWTPAPDVLNVSQAVYEAPGPCSAPLAAPAPAAPLDNAASTFTVSSLSDGSYCFSIRAMDLTGATADSPGVTVAIDTASPTAALLVAGRTSGSVAGVVSLTPASADATSGVASSIVHVGAPGACPGGAALGPDWDTTAYGNGVYEVCNVVTDNAGHRAIATVTMTVANARAPAALSPVARPQVARPVDKVAPRKPKRLVVVAPRAKRGTRLVPFTLHWARPKAPDLDRVVVVLNLQHAPINPTDGRVVDRGLRTSVRFKLHARVKAHIALYAYDHSGNVSRAARRVVSLATLIPTRPLSGSVMRKAPRLRWKARKHAAYYNLQLFRNGKRVLLRWPDHPFYRLPARRLRPGTYVWFVWPAVRHSGAAPSFGSLIGRSTFVIKGEPKRPK